MDLFLLLPLVFLGAILSVIGGGGLVMIVIVAGSLFTDVREIVMISAYLILASQLLKSIRYYKYINWFVVRWYIAAGIPMIILGCIALLLVPNNQLKMVVGILGVLLGSMQLLDLFPRLQATKSNLLTTGALGGFLGGFMGNGAIVSKPILLAMGLQKEVFLGTTSGFNFLLTPIKLLFYTPNMQWSADLGLFLMASWLCVAAGIKVGSMLLPYVSAQQFRILLNGVIVIGSLRLLFG